MFRTDIDYTEKLKDVLTEEDSLLTSIYEGQKEIRKSVNERNWETLQDEIYKVNNLTSKFSELEAEREECFQYFGLKDNSSFYTQKNQFSKEATEEFTTLYNSVKQKLIASKIENDALNDYINITQKFLQGVFDKVLPQRKVVVYSRNGALVKNQPKSMVLDTVL